jgi:hypothetical protein
MPLYAIDRLAVERSGYPVFRKGRGQGKGFSNSKMPDEVGFLIEWKPSNTPIYSR